jgi:hypothetical protein
MLAVANDNKPDRPRRRFDWHLMWALPVNAVLWLIWAWALLDIWQRN